MDSIKEVTKELVATVNYQVSKTMNMRNVVEVYSDNAPMIARTVIVGIGETRISKITGQNCDNLAEASDDTVMRILQRFLNLSSIDVRFLPRGDKKRDLYLSMIGERRVLLTEQV